MNNARMRPSALGFPCIALLLIGCAQPKPLSIREQKLPAWEDYAGDDAALLYLALHDSPYERQHESLVASGYEFESDYGAQAVAIPRARPILLADGKGKLKYYFGTRDPVRLEPGWHEFELELTTPAAQTFEYDPSAPTEFITSFPALEREVAPGQVYCLLVHRRGRQDATVYWQPLGPLDAIRRLAEIPDPLPAEITGPFGAEDPELWDVYRRVMEQAKGYSP